MIADKPSGKGILNPDTPAGVSVFSDDGGALAWFEEFFCPPFLATETLSAYPRVEYCRDGDRFAAMSRRFEGSSTRSVPCFSLDTRTVEHPALQQGDQLVVRDFQDLARPSPLAACEAGHGPKATARPETGSLFLQRAPPPDAPRRLAGPSWPLMA